MSFLRSQALRVWPVPAVLAVVAAVMLRPAPPPPHPSSTADSPHTAGAPEVAPSPERSVLLAAHAQDAADQGEPGESAAGVAFFEQKIRPVLVAHCYKCHSAKAKKSRGGLSLDTGDAFRRGGDSGPAFVAGQPEKSLLMKSLRHEENAMPPTRRLPDHVIADFERWVRMGAPDPRAAKGRPVAPESGIDLEKGRQHWAFQPLRSHQPPQQVRDVAWPRSVVDRFVLARLEAQGLHPAPDADRATLLRRATVALTGLPPTPEELDAFLSDPRPDAFARVVDRLLASPGFGERWGRHWLDVARYADSSGKGDNLTYHDAWRYRDFAIAAFNQDKPFNDFVREQVAGDLLPARSQAERDEKVIATGFLAVGPKVLADRDVLRRKMDVVDDQVDTLGRAFLGLTLGCARCHDHKLDPIPTTDYYALAGILASTRTLEGLKQNNAAVTGWVLRGLGGEDAERQAAAWRAHREQLRAATQAIADARSDKAPRRRIDELIRAAEQVHQATPPLPAATAMAVADEDAPGDIHVNIRGNPHALGARVPRGFVTVATRESGPPTIPANESGRRQLAEWLASDRNPLTARVIVNRVWMHLFGEGLVRSVDDFGLQGERPTHPELLDALAAEFVEDGWSVKRLVRRLMLTRTYGMSSAVKDDRAARVDPENRQLWRAHRRRVEAEVIRDAMLLASGELDRTRGGGSAVAHLGEVAVANNNSTASESTTDEAKRRSVYLPIVRNHLPGVFDVFDFADPDATTGRRDATTVATQALYLMNSDFARGRADATADRLLALPAERRVTELYRRALGRAPTEGERRRVEEFLAGEPDERRGWSAVCQMVFGSTEFRFVE